MVASIQLNSSTGLNTSLNTHIPHMCVFYRQSVLDTQITSKGIHRALNHSAGSFHCSPCLVRRRNATSVPIVPGSTDVSIKVIFNHEKPSNNANLSISFIILYDWLLFLLLTCAVRLCHCLSDCRAVVSMQVVTTGDVYFCGFLLLICLVTVISSLRAVTTVLNNFCSKIRET